MKKNTDVYILNLFSNILQDNCSNINFGSHGQKYVINVNTLWTGDADLRLYITTVQDG